MPEALGVGLIGYGFAGKTFHAPLIAAVPGMALRAIASSDAAKVKKDFPDVAVFADPKAMLAQSDIALVVIATPNDTHAPLAQAALEAGKAVVIDKPFTIDMKEARGLMRLAEQKGLLLSVFHNRRWDSDFLGARFSVESGLLGMVTHFESHIDRFRPQVRDRWREQSVPGSGVWYDLSPHMIDQVLTLFGLPDSIQANFAFERPGAKAVDWAHAVLTYPRLRVILHASMLVAGGTAKFLIHGDKGSLIKRGIDQQEAQALKGMKPGAPGWGDDPDPLLIWDAQGHCHEMPTPSGDHRLYYANIRDALTGLAPNQVPAIQALAVMAVLEGGIEAAATGKRIPVPLTAEERTAYQASRAA
ncbi:MAG TPA: oxidoreductase [Rhizomicrobium sp.]|nr:oxidoreductase [Rhizomicrobium sp.]